MAGRPKRTFCNVENPVEFGNVLCPRAQRTDLGGKGKVVTKAGERKDKIVWERESGREEKTKKKFHLQGSPMLMWT